MSHGDFNVAGRHLGVYDITAQIDAGEMGRVLWPSLRFRCRVAINMGIW